MCSTRKLLYRRRRTLLIRGSEINSGMSSSTVNRYVVSNATESSRTERAEADVYEFAVAVGLQLRERQQSRSVIGKSKREQVIQA